MNILTFDIEEWYIEKIYHGDRSAKYQEFDRILNEILDLLDKTNKKGTFFCLGKLASDFPEVVKLIDARGFEIGCHSDKHQWLTKLSKDEVFEDTKNAVNSLEQCIGKKVISYRAPAFSIGESNKWAFEVLAKCGIKYDASVFPAVRDFGGFPKFGSKIPSRILYNGSEIKEFPIQTTKILGKDIIYSGGGYFRLLPINYIKYMIKRNDYNMTYFHIGDLVKEKKAIMSKSEYEEYFKESGSYANRVKRYLKSNIGTGNAMSKLKELIIKEDFLSLSEANNMINWENSPIIKLD